MTRKAQPAPPLPCFGSEHDAATLRCQACPHATGCQEAMGTLLNKIPVSHVVYSLLPAAFQTAPSELPDRSLVSLNGFFQEAHRVVYRQASRHSLQPDCRRIKTDAEAVGTSPFLFMVALMWSHDQTSPGHPFHPAKFIASDAVKRVQSVKEVCLRKFASYDLLAMDGTLNETLSKDSPRLRLLEDEIRVGQFIVARKIISGGPSAPPMFRALELTLGLDWLAVEPAYRLYASTEPASTDAIREHRTRVSLRHGELKKRKALAISVFQARELIAPEAVRRVLSAWKLEPKHLLTTNQPVTDMLLHWTRIGICLQHLECLRALNGQPNAYGVTCT